MMFFNVHGISTTTEKREDVNTASCSQYCKDLPDGDRIRRVFLTGTTGSRINFCSSSQLRSVT